MQIHKDLGHVKSVEKKADFEGHSKESIVEDHRTQKSETNKQVSQSEKKEISSDGRQVTTTSFSSSESFSMEETEEYGFEDDGTTLALN